MPTYTGPQNVAINVANPGVASIRYEMGSNPPDPTPSSPLYDGTPFVVDSSTIIKARNFCTDGTPSVIAQIEIIIGLMVYHGYSPLAMLNEAQLLAMVNTPLNASESRSDSLGSYDFGSGAGVNDYFYFWWPATYTDPRANTGFVDPSTGFPVAMATNTEGFTDGPINGYFYKNLTVNGVAGKLYRSYFQIGSSTQTTLLVQ